TLNRPRSRNRGDHHRHAFAHAPTRQLRRVALGVGHTLTIFIVGAAIILFDIVIPPRLGLSMEFAVALMLILLGVLNLTGVLAWFTGRVSPTHVSSDSSVPANMTNSQSQRLLDRALSRF